MTPEKRKNAVAIILGGVAHDPKKDDAKDEGEDDADVGLETAFDELVAAVKSGDTKAGVAALCSFIDQHEARGDEAPKSGKMMSSAHDDDDDEEDY